jgi:hypothetical protein
MAKNRVKNRSKLGSRPKTLKETMRDSKKARGSLKKRVTARIAKLLGF